MKSEAFQDTSKKTPRIVVLNSDAAELMLALQAGSLIVGKDDANTKSGIFKSLNNVPRVGKWSNPNIEAIVALHPDIVITYDNWPEKKELDDKLAPFGIKVERIAGYRIETLVSDIKRLGTVTGKTKEADELIGFAEQYISLLKTRCSEVKKKRKVYFEFRSYVALGKGSGGDQLLQLISTKNVTSEFGLDYPEISPEWLLAKDPELIVMNVSKEEINSGLFNDRIDRQGWENLSAVKNNNAYLISNEISSSPRGIIGALYIAKWSYPDKFEDIDPGKIHAKWLKKFHNVNTDKLYVYP